MLRDSRSTDVDQGGREDRISVLPKNVIDYIVQLLPVEDAARTSILSKKWRYIWAMLSNLVLDELFCNKLAEKSSSFFYKTVDNILLLRIGDFVKFELDVSGVALVSYTDINRWMLYVTRNGVKTLKLNMSKNSTYKVPSYIFNCPTLTELELYNCVFKLPNCFLGFQSLKTLYLESITIVPIVKFCVIKAPLLVDLTLKYCQGTQYLIIVSPQLESIGCIQSDYLELNFIRNCKILTTVLLCYERKVVDYCPSSFERSTLGKFLFSLPKLEELHLNSCFLELLTADTVPKGLPFALDCLSFLTLDVDFGKLSQTSCTQQLIKTSPNLSELNIWVDHTNGNNAEAVLEYLVAPAACIEQPLNKLKRVALWCFQGSKAELAFVKLLFAGTPSLERMSIYPVNGCSRKEWDIAVELMRFPRASPRAELFYLPDAVWPDGNIKH